MSYEITDRHMKKPELGDTFESNDYQSNITVTKVEGSVVTVEETYVDRGEKKILEKFSFASPKDFQEHYSFMHAPGYTIHFLDSVEVT